MRIEQLPGLKSELVTSLQGSGIGSCRQLLRISRRPEKLSRLASSLGSSPGALQQIVHRAELCQIRGVGPAALAHLWQVGIDSPAALAAAEAEPLRTQLAQVSTRPPNLAVIEDWIYQARTL
jgi:predicted flap endonuclease-1-like 5' DNA nuclease